MLSQSFSRDKARQSKSSEVFAKQSQKVQEIKKQSEKLKQMKDKIREEKKRELMSGAYP